MKSILAILFMYNLRVYYNYVYNYVSMYYICTYIAIYSRTSFIRLSFIRTLDYLKWDVQKILRQVIPYC